MSNLELPPPPWQRTVPKRSRPVKAPLNRDEIVDAGLRLVVEEGVDAVSMRRIAAVFDTGASSLYAHVANKEELLQLMYDRVCGLIELPTPDPARWTEQIKDIARQGHAVLMRHNDLARTALATVPSGPNSLRITEVMLAVMLGAGVAPRVAAWALDRLFLYITADAYEMSLQNKMLTAEGIEELSGQLADYFTNLPAEHFPYLRANAGVIIAGDSTDRFEFGLDLIVDGIARSLDKEPGGA
ncbi:TetR/AcrR family transcriptional regulator [Actinoplanes sp. N902-109]|uniref:TetR/AcrR family transcriptional regulator n=1 Tax=Actinoplanes sp. (strain N902-109) TaxID=649831 RepID=UPI000329369E|nr:TetR/AcrR family transcriptional regulator [Actinoplanes sp. N902-109]AGL14077.1 TetR family transcriptional regulator [Actinoplanes sp. N902-109]